MWEHGVTESKQLLIRVVRNTEGVFWCVYLHEMVHIAAYGAFEKEQYELHTVVLVHLDRGLNYRTGTEV